MLNLVKQLSLILELAKFKFGDLSAQHHRHTCIKLKLAILNLVKIRQIAKLKTLQTFPAIWDVENLLVYKRV